VTEPGLEDTISILRGLKERYEVRGREGGREGGRERGKEEWRKGVKGGIATEHTCTTNHPFLSSLLPSLFLDRFTTECV